MPIDEGNSGVTFLSTAGSYPELGLKLSGLMELQKYRNKADYWVAIGSKVTSDPLLSVVIQADKPWRQDERMQRLAAAAKNGTQVKPRKIGRNEPCPCGSGLKYKRCHGQ